MRYLCIIQFLLLLSVIAAQRGGSGSNGGNPSIFGNHDPSDCLCFLVHQLCDPSSAVPKGATKISLNDLRIVNTNPRAVCPEGRALCCFSGLGTGHSGPQPEPVFSNSCGTRKSLAQGLPNTAHADFGEYPWNVAITTPNNDFVATGALISPDFILTAAHSINNKGNNLLVRLGDYDLGDENELPQYPHQVVGVSQIIVHQGFNHRNLFNDVALLRLQFPVSYEAHIRPVCLPERGQRFGGSRCWVAGFGEDENHQFSRIIREVDVPIMNGIDCQAALSGELGSSFILNTESFICAGGEKGKDACRGDGGAPLVCEEFNTGRFTVVGLVAWGLKDSCGRPGIPGVYVNIASFSDFIANYVPISI